MSDGYELGERFPYEERVGNAVCDFYNTVNFAFATRLATQEVELPDLKATEEIDSLNSAIGPLSSGVEDMLKEMDEGQKKFDEKEEVEKLITRQDQTFNRIGLTICEYGPNYSYGDKDFLGVKDRPATLDICNATDFRDFIDSSQVGIHNWQMFELLGQAVVESVYEQILILDSLALTEQGNKAAIDEINKWRSIFVEDFRVIQPALERQDILDDFKDYKSTCTLTQQT